MNTKANAPAANAPTAKDDNKAADTSNTKAANNGKHGDDNAAIALAEKAANMNADQRKALALLVLEGDANEEEQKLFAIIQAENTKANNARKVHVDAIEAAVKALAGTHRPLSLNDMKKLIDNHLISRDLIAAVAQEYGLLKGGKATAAKKQASTSAQGGGVQRASDANEIVLAAPKFSYKIGRVYEDNLGKPTADKSHAAKNAWVSLPKAIINNATTEAQLKTIATDAGKKYFATDEGKAELKAIVAFAHAHADYKAQHGEANTGAGKQA